MFTKELNNVISIEQCFQKADYIFMAKNESGATASQDCHLTTILVRKPSILHYANLEQRYLLFEVWTLLVFKKGLTQTI